MTDRYQLHNGDCLSVLKTLPDGCVDCIVTSPPYWGLRSYVADGDPLKQFEQGLESTPAEYVARMVEVFRECRRVLADDGTCFVNLGDSFYGGGNNRSGEGEARNPSDKLHGGIDTLVSQRRVIGTAPGLKPKDLVGIPWRVAFALQADGWWLRQDIIWHKPNPMPESVRDRCTKAHEYIFLLTKSERYWWDGAAIAETAVGCSGGAPIKIHEARGGDQQGLMDGWAGSTTRNRRDVWTIASEPYPEAHFATFPTEIPRLCILAGCKPEGVVMDIFAGSGTTLQVAMELGHKAIGIELNPKYGGLIRKRCANAAAQKRMF